MNVIPEPTWKFLEQKYLPEIEEEDKVVKKAFDDAKYQFYKTLFTRQFVVDFMTDGKLPDEGTGLKKQYLDYTEKAYLQNSTKSPFIFVTINPYATTEHVDFVRSVVKFVSKKTIDSYAYVFEIRESPDKGLHCHALVKYNCKPFDFKRSTQSTFSKICDSKNPHVLNFKFINPEDCLSKVDYMLGKKTEKKQKGVKDTIAYRALNNLADIYESSPPLPCRATQLLVEEPPTKV